MNPEYTISVSKSDRLVRLSIDELVGYGDQIISRPNTFYLTHEEALQVSFMLSETVQDFLYKDKNEKTN